MITKLLEAKAIINQKTIVIINTEMDISVEYDFNKDNLDVKSVFGEFSYSSKAINFDKKTTIKFNTDNTWNFSISWLKKLGFQGFIEIQPPE